MSGERETVVCIRSSLCPKIESRATTIIHPFSHTKNTPHIAHNKRYIQPLHTPGANPFPKVTDLFCRLPLTTLFYRLEVSNLGDLMRLSVRPGGKFTSKPQRFMNRQKYPRQVKHHNLLCRLSEPSLQMICRPRSRRDVPGCKTSTRKEISP